MYACVQARALGSRPPPKSLGTGRRVGLVWLRSDLRLHDHEPLSRAHEQCDSVAHVYCFDPRVQVGERVG